MIRTLEKPTNSTRAIVLAIHNDGYPCTCCRNYMRWVAIYEGRSRPTAARRDDHQGLGLLLDVSVPVTGK